MLKTPGYDEVSGGYQQKEAIALGGHHMIIKQVTETMSKGNSEKGTPPRPMVVVLLDFAQNDKQAGLFMNEFKADERSDKKWPSRGSQYIMTQDWNDPSKTNRSFKSFCTCYERSNNTQIKWVEDPVAWSAQFKNKRIGGVFGIVHDIYNGREITKTELRWFATDDSVETATIPNEKMLSDDQKAKLSQQPQAQQSRLDLALSQQTPDANGFINIPEGIDEELPFN